MVIFFICTFSYRPEEKKRKGSEEAKKETKEKNEVRMKLKNKKREQRNVKQEHTKPTCVWNKNVKAPKKSWDIRGKKSQNKRKKKEKSQKEVREQKKI